MKKILVLLIGVLLTVFVLSGCGSSKSGTFASSTPVAGPNVNSSTAPTISRPSTAFKKHGCLAFVWDGLLYGLDGSTGRVAQLTKSGEALRPVWSYDGRWLAFIRVTDSQAMTGPLWLVRRDGTQAHQVQRLPGPVTASSFAWSPAADELAVSQKDGLWLVPVQGSPARLVATKAAPGFLWSPDGKSLAYSVWRPSNRGSAWGVLYTVAATGGKPARQLVAPAYCWIQLAAWWPDGQGLLYCLDPDYSCSLAADGLRLWSLRLGESTPKSLGTALTYRDWLSFSPRGRLLMVDGDGRMVWANKRLAVYDVTTGKGDNLPNPAGKVALDPAFSPDGEHIAFVTAKDLGNYVGGSDGKSKLAAWVASRALWIENADGSGAHPLPSAGTGVYQPAWSRDGKSIMYVRDNALWMISAGGGTPQRIMELSSSTSKDLFGYYGYVRYDNFSWFQPAGG